MELAILGLGAVGCVVVLLVALAGVAIQALFLHYGAKMAGVDAPYSRAFWAMLAVAFVNGIVQIAMYMGKSPEELQLTWANVLRDSLLNLGLSLVIGTIVVTWIYAIPVLRAFLAFATSIVLMLVTWSAIVATVLGVVWAVGGEEGVDQFIEARKQSYYDRLEDRAVEEGIDPSTVAPTPVSLLDDVEFTEFDNAVDIRVAEARDYIGKKVRVVHGPRSESIGTLKEVTGTTLIVSVRISGGRIDEPIQKSKVTTFQWIPPG